MMSTKSNRTMQSGYSELMGMFNTQTEQNVQLTNQQEEATSVGGVASPPFQVRDQRVIIEKLGDYALPDGFVQMPIFNHLEVSMADDLDMNGCQYV